ncbi:MAG TPA: protein kinase [Thermoanaerobaculia bacterium]|nr:protein kinase [Thermoanaerobaculia bacterium]
MLAPGETLGPYTIVDLLGVGGMGEVYRARDQRLNRDVAIKVLPSDVAADKLALQRFRREARAVAALSHPNICAIFDFGSDAGVEYAVMELLEGETLRVRMTRQRLTADEALALFAEIVDGVAAAHAQGIVHRDLKPDNVFITTSGRVKVLDFGLARGGNEDAETEPFTTQTGIVMGTIGYLAPEQVEGRAPAPQTDVFALGCILYELIAGDLPFRRPYDEALRLEHHNADVLVQRCLRKDPNERYPDAAALASAVRASLGGARLPSRRAFPWLLVLSVLIVLSLASYFVLTRNPVVDQGYDLRTNDIRADPETRRILTLALHADSQGNRPKARELLEEAWRRGAPTAIPAALLSSFGKGSGDAKEAARWRNAALTRLNGASPYESLLVRYFLSDNAQKELALSKSALELRPRAWRLRLGAAHIHFAQRQREAALRELVQIDVEKPDDRRLMLVLADRASLGDAEGAERDLHRSTLMQRPPLRQYTEGRIAWARGNAAEARRHYERAAQEAAAENSTQLEVESHMLSGVASLQLHDWTAAQRSLARGATLARDYGLPYRQFENTMLGAYAAHRAGDFEQRDAKFDAAQSLTFDDFTRSVLRLLAIRLRSDAWKSWPLPPMRDEPSVAPLVRARELWFAGDRDGALRELRRANAEGIDATPFREEAELLAAELGQPFQKMPLDTPYPNLMRWLAIFDLPPAPLPPPRGAE